MFTDIVSDLAGAFSFLTTLPVERLQSKHDRPPGAVFAYFPLVGLVIGLLIAAVDSFRVLPADLVAFLTLVAWVALTGGLHLDGFADSCDGLLATVTPERRLEIMKDPRAGSWAVVGVILLLLGKWVTLQHVNPGALVLPPVAGRWAMTLAAAWFPGARASGSGAHFREGLGRSQVIAASLTSVIVAVFLGWRGLVALLVSILFGMALARWASGRLGGGLTGDTYGAICEVVELVCLTLLVTA